MNKTIDVQDLYLAVYLFMEGVPILEHSRRFGYSTFTFDQNDRTQGLIDNFMKSDNPFMRFASALRQLKSLMYSEDSRNLFSNQTTQHVKQSQGNLIGA